MKKFLLFTIVIVFAISAFSAPGIYLNRAKTMKQNKIMMRTYYVYSSMTQTMPISTSYLYANTGILFSSYGLTDDITIGTNLFYVHKKFENSILPVAPTSHGLDDIVTLIKFAILKNKTSYLSGAFSIKWNSAFYVSSDSTPTIGTNSTDIIGKILYDKKVGKVWITLIPSYTFMIKNNSNYDNEIRFISTGSMNVWKNKLFTEMNIDLDYTFNSDSNADPELIWKGLFGLQYKINENIFAQVLLGYGENTDNTKTFKMLRTGFSFNY